MDLSRYPDGRNSSVFMSLHNYSFSKDSGYSLLHCIGPNWLSDVYRTGRKSSTGLVGPIGDRRVVYVPLKSLRRAEHAGTAPYCRGSV